MPIPAHVNVLEVGETARLISFQVKKGRCSAEGVWSMTVDKSRQARRSAGALQKGRSEST